jgi:lysozyme
MGDHVTPEKATEYLRQDLQEAEKEVNKIMNLTQSQFDALVSFVYNVGAGVFRRSTLFAKVKQNPNDPSIPGEFRKWVHGAGGRVLPGLVKRRDAEANFYLGIA